MAFDYIKPTALYVEYSLMIVKVHIGHNVWLTITAKTIKQALQSQML